MKENISLGIAVAGFLLAILALFLDSYHFSVMQNSDIILDCSIPKNSNIEYIEVEHQMLFDTYCIISNSGNRTRTVTRIDSVAMYKDEPTGYELTPISKIDSSKYLSENQLPLTLEAGNALNIKVKTLLPIDLLNYKEVPKLEEKIDSCFKKTIHELHFIAFCLSAGGFTIIDYLNSSPYLGMGTFDGVGVRIFTDDKRSYSSKIDFKYDTPYKSDPAKNHKI